MHAAQVTRPGAIDPSVIEVEEDRETIGRYRRHIWIATIAGYLAVFILWPCLMAPAGGTWSIGYFRFYVVLAFIFIIVASAIGIFLPLWEARGLFLKVSSY